MSEEKELTNEERAKLLLERGQKSFENNNFLEALHYFKISNKLLKNFQTDEYIKKCEEKIKEIREKEKEEEKKEENGENPKNEEDEACEKIINNKDYYDILGITKETSNDDIKKAYKKLAIKFHPDKNKSPKAEEAFKKIATAYQTLTDPKKRELFDKYGSEEEYREKVYQERQQAYEDDFDAYDIFDMFFGNIDPEVLRRQRRRYRRAQTVQVNPKVAKYLPFIQLIPILLMGLTYILPNLFQSKDLYVFERHKDYPFEKKTHRYKINYYIGNDFKEKYKDKNKNELRIIEKEIENKYASYLRINCQEKRQLREEIQIKLMYYRKGSYYYNILLNELNKLDFNVCEKLWKYLNKMEKKDDEEDEYEDDEE
jgi:DnaJ family protein B protein 12